MTKKAVEPATLAIQGWVDIRDVAGVIRQMHLIGAEPSSWSDLINWAFKRLAFNPPELVGEALEIVEKTGLSLKQLKRRGTGIRQAIAKEDLGDLRSPVEKRAEEIRKMMEEEDE